MAGGAMNLGAEDKLGVDPVEEDVGGRRLWPLLVADRQRQCLQVGDLMAQFFKIILIRF